MQMSGLLGTFPPAELLQWAQNDGLTGTLVLRRSSREKRVLLRDGNIVGCLSNERYEFYGEYLLAMGYVDEEQLLDALSHCERSSTGLRLGEALVELEILDRDGVVRTLVEQTEQSILDVFLWPRGVFYVLEDAPPEAPIEIPPIEPLPLILEGVRQIDEVGRIRERLPHDAVTLKVGVAWPGEDLEPVARRIVNVFRNGLTLAELHNATGGGYCRFLSEVDRLVSGDVLAIKRMGEPAPDTRSLSLLDLMLDRVQEGRQASIGGTVAMPLSALGELYPVWLDRGDDSTVAEPPEALTSFARSLDGSSKLATLLSDAADRRESELEWLWLQMGARRLVLLPQALGSELVERLAGL